MVRNSILFYDPEKSNRNEAKRVLTATGGNCFTPESLSELLELATTQKYAIYVLDISGHEFLSQHNVDLTSGHTIILSKEKLGKIQNYLSTMDQFSNFIAKNRHGKLHPKDLLVTVSKLLNNNIFGLRKYLSWGAANIVYHVRDSRQREDYIGSIVEYCKTMGLRSSIINSVETFCEELLMNAFYDAPRDESGPIYASKSRTQTVMLSPNDAARMEFASDGERLAISVADPFGSINRNTVLKYLSKCFDENREGIVDNLETSGGAGLGLFFCFNAVSSFIINVSPGQKSEFIGLIDIQSPVKESHNRNQSFHFFSTNNMAQQFITNHLDESSEREEEDDEAS